MRSKGQYIGAQRSIDGDLIVSFAIEDESTLEALDKLKEKDLVLEVKKYSNKRSLNANAYFWKLCDMIAQALGTTKDEIYLLQLSRYGFWLDKEVIKEAIPEIKEMFRLVEVFDDEWIDYQIDDKGNIQQVPMQTIRCYIGSSHYSKREMGRLIDGTVQDAKELGIDTWTPDEIARVLAEWEAR